jgi:tetratricopeptide (TPR) repeat protein
MTMSDPIRDLYNVFLEIIQTSASSDLSAAVEQVGSELDRNGELTQSLQTDARMLQTNLSQSKDYPVLAEANAALSNGDRPSPDSEAAVKSLGQLLDQIALHQGLVETPQNLPCSSVVEFVGRTQKLEELHTQLQQNESSAPKVSIAITAIAGMGGIGKTELAIQYALKQLKQGKYPAGVCWLSAGDREIATQIVMFAQVHLGLIPPDRLEIDAQVRFCWQQWPEGDAIVILDDVTDYEAIEQYLPSDPRFKLLITTRLQLGSSAKKFPVEELDEESAIALLESWVGCDRIQSQLDDAKALCKWVEYLPFALELLGRFLACKPERTIDRLPKVLDDHRLEIKALTAPESVMTAKLGVVAALELSWQELSEAEQALACLLGMFAIAPIPWPLVEQCLQEDDPKELEDARDNGLMARSLVKRVGEGGYQLHRIVQEYFRIKLEQRFDRGAGIKESFCRAMVEIAQTIDDTPTIAVIEGARSAIVHLEEVASRWIDSLTKEDLIWPFVGAGRFYEVQGNYTFAEPCLRKCLEATQNLLGQEHPYVVTSLDNLALLYSNQGRYKEAEPLCLQALQMTQGLLGQKHPYVATSLNNLALLYSNQGRYEEAEALYLQALQIRQKRLGQEHPDVSTSLHNLGTLYQRQGKHREARALYNQAIAIAKASLGPKHPNTLRMIEWLKSLPK